LKKLVKGILHALFLALAFPLALLSAFGRIESVYQFWAHTVALAPGLPGDYLRIAYYYLTLDKCALESRIQMGSFFAHSRSIVGSGVYIGHYCVLGHTEIGDRAQIASCVQILSGRRQHARDGDGRILSSAQGTFETISIGADCWIGASAIVMADVGSATTIGAGTVVINPIPSRAVAVGNPARVISVSDSGSITTETLVAGARRTPIPRQ
jgi:acetyltransferase-like isoleucine patch superfamily enzyme